MSEEGKEKIHEATVTFERRSISKAVTQTDPQFMVALVMIFAYAILLLIPVLTSNSDMFQLVAAAISGPIGSIIGYYFGTKAKAEPITETGK